MNQFCKAFPNGPQPIIIALDDTAKAILNGLITDGSHYKQFYLEDALKSLCGEEWVKEAKREFQWEDGIPL